MFSLFKSLTIASITSNTIIILFTQVSVFSVRALTKDYPFRALVRGFLIQL